ncbi:MAG: phage portal protein [Actinomyces sp.]|nr:phage portal protein [Actinomyces sp.]
MQMTAVYSCVRILAETIAGLPLHVYQTRSDGGKEKAVSHPLYRLLHDEPNPEMTSFVFRETGPLCKLLTVCLCDCCPGRLV